jgi:hypothetical protein
MKQPSILECTFALSGLRLLERTFALSGRHGTHLCLERFAVTNTAY